MTTRPARVTHDGSGDEDGSNRITSNQEVHMTAPLPDPWPGPDPTPYPASPEPSPRPDDAPVHIVNLPPDTIPPGISIDNPDHRLTED